MLIEYKFKFEENGFTLTQRIEPSVSNPKSIEEQLIEEDLLRFSYQESKTAETAEPKPGGSGVSGHFGGDLKKVFPSDANAPITLIGPFIMCCHCSDAKKGG